MLSLGSLRQLYSIRVGPLPPHELMLFNGYKEHVIELLQRICTVSVRTMEMIQQMPDTVEHQD
ncbi:hypothetical protein ACQ4M4_13720 [Leptolyngbya sp. AN02str]|uniref:hypothetical protein n=1 Tax=Leptolyngbya sp. AN02str TaxID=3423363 RepID=UPI003D312546